MSETDFRAFVHHSSPEKREAGYQAYTHGFARDSYDGLSTRGDAEHAASGILTIIYRVLILLTQTQDWPSNRDSVLRRIKLICRRADRILFGDPVAASRLNSDITIAFPELFRLQSFGVHGRASFDRSHSTLVWVREALTKLLAKFSHVEANESMPSTRLPPTRSYRSKPDLSWRVFL
jgi:hypothetical protein